MSVVQGTVRVTTGSIAGVGHGVALVTSVPIAGVVRWGADALYCRPFRGLEGHDIRHVVGYDGDCAEGGGPTSGATAGVRRGRGWSPSRRGLARRLDRGRGGGRRPSLGTYRVGGAVERCKTDARSEGVAVVAVARLGTTTSESSEVAPCPLRRRLDPYLVYPTVCVFTDLTVLGEGGVWLQYVHSKDLMYKSNLLSFWRSR